MRDANLRGGDGFGRRPYFFLLAGRNNPKVGNVPRFVAKRGKSMSDKNKNDKEARLEEARKALLDTLNSLRKSALSAKEADAISRD